MSQIRRSFFAKSYPGFFHAPCGVAAVAGWCGRAAVGRVAMRGLILVAGLGLPLAAAAQSVIGTVAAGNNPVVIAVNPATNKIYVANRADGDVMVIDGATDATTTVTTGNSPVAIAVNSVTNKIYVANLYSNDVTVIDGATNATTTVGVGDTPIAIAVNPLTNKIYVANNGTDDVTVIDGATNATTAVSAGDKPVAIAVNPATNKIYVSNSHEDTVTAIDGETNLTTTLILGVTGYGPSAIAVNPVTNKIYVVISGSSNVSVIDGGTGSITMVSAGTGGGLSPTAVAVNPVTNEVYVADSGKSLVTVIDGATNALNWVNVGSAPVAIAVNPLNDQLYVTNSGDNTTSVIDGTTNTTTTLSTGNGPIAVAVNPLTDHVYVANSGGNDVTVIDGAKNTTTTLNAGNAPSAAAVNSATDKVYVTNSGGDTVTAIDGATNSTSTVSVGNGPLAVAVNQVTNKIYVTNTSGDTVTTIDGATNATSTVSVGPNPYAIAVNQVTNKIYVTIGDNTVTVIDGATNATSTVHVGNFPDAVAVNSATNKIYVANGPSNTVTVIDGVTNATATVGVGTDPCAIAVNPATNKIYVVNLNGNNVTVIDGATNSTTTVSVGDIPSAVAVNPATNTIYVTNFGDDSVTVIDGATNATSTVSVGNGPQVVAVNPVTNQVYTANYYGNTMTVIDGATNSTSTVSVGMTPDALAVNPVINRVYLANYADGTASAIDVDGTQLMPLLVTAAGADDALTVNGTSIFATANLTPAFTATVTSDFTNFPGNAGISALNPMPGQLFYWVDDGSMASWKAATVTSGPYQNPAQFSITLPQQSLGVHTLYLFADYGDEGQGVSSTAGTDGSPMISNLQAIPYAILRVPTMTTLRADTNPQSVGQTVNFTATVTPGTSRTALPTGIVQFYDGATLLGESTLTQNGSTYTATYAWIASGGSNTIEAIYGGDGNYAASTATLTETVEGAPAAINIVAGNNQTSAVGTAYTYGLEVQVVDADNIPVPNVAVNFSGSGIRFSSGGVAVTNANGEVSMAATPIASGTLSATASVAGLSATAAFTETGTGSGPEAPVIAWPTPAPIAYGTALNATQLDATASYGGTTIPGTFVFTPASGTVPGVGAQTLSVTFTPDNQTTYSTATATVTLQVTQATPTLTWAAPAAITYGTALSATQLNATAGYSGTPVAGGFSYSPAAGTVLTAGTQTLGVTFTPSNTTDYAIASTTVSIAVNQATPSLNWTAPGGINYGTPLTSTQLNATASVPGQFTYTPPLGTMLGAGSQTLGVAFVPDDTTDYKAASTSVQIAVGKATPVITWAALASIPYGTALGATQLNATANAAGSFTYSPAAGTVLPLGTTTLTATFTPTDATDYFSPVTATVQLTVTAAAVSDFSVSASPAQQIVSAGNSAVYLVAVTPLNGNFNSAVGFSASGVPPGFTASFSPSSVTPGTAAANTTMTLSRSSAAASNGRTLFPLGGMGLLAVVLVGFDSRRAREASRRWLVAVLVLFSLGAAAVLTGCQTNGSSQYKNYVVTLTATAGSVSHTTEVILTVE